MKIQFHPEAEAEFNAAIDYYEKIDCNLGMDFAMEVHEAIARIAKIAIMHLHKNPDYWKTRL